jgi:hypothetical protein
MPVGPGKYGARAEAILRDVGGSLCIVLVVGNKGPGFDVASTNPLLLMKVPELLREVADEIERTLAHVTDIEELQKREPASRDTTSDAAMRALVCKTCGASVASTLTATLAARDLPGLPCCADCGAVLSAKQQK